MCRCMTKSPWRKGESACSKCLKRWMLIQPYFFSCLNRAILSLGALLRMIIEDCHLCVRAYDPLDLEHKMEIFRLCPSRLVCPIVFSVPLAPAGDNGVLRPPSSLPGPFFRGAKIPLPPLPSPPIKTRPFCTDWRRGRDAPLCHYGVATERGGGGSRKSEEEEVKIFRDNGTFWHACQTDDRRGGGISIIFSEVGADAKMGLGWEVNR